MLKFLGCNEELEKGKKQVGKENNKDKIQNKRKVKT